MTQPFVSLGEARAAARDIAADVIRLQFKFVAINDLAYSAIGIAAAAMRLTLVILEENDDAARRLEDVRRALANFEDMRRQKFVGGNGDAPGNK